MISGGLVYMSGITGAPFLTLSTDGEEEESVSGWVGGRQGASPSTSFSHSLGSTLQAMLVLEIWH